MGGQVNLTLAAGSPRFRGSSGSWASGGEQLASFIDFRRQTSDGGMPPAGIVLSIDELEAGHPGLGVGAEAVQALDDFERTVANGLSDISSVIGCKSAPQS